MSEGGAVVGKVKEQCLEVIYELVSVRQLPFVVFFALITHSILDGASFSPVATLSHLDIRSFVGWSTGLLWDIELLIWIGAIALAVANETMLKACIKRSLRSAKLDEKSEEWVALSSSRGVPAHPVRVRSYQSLDIKTRMATPHHYTAHLDDHIAFWIVAHVHKLDTHAEWSAEWHSRRDDGSTINSGWLFRNYSCSVSILREFVRRGIVVDCVAAAPEHVSEDELAGLNELHEEPDVNIWFEIVVDTFTEQTVNFSLSVWAYKYHLTNLALPKQLYYLFSDRLGAQVRFVHEWFALESTSGKLEAVLHRGKILPSVAGDIRHELALLKTPSEAQIHASCRSLFPLLERAMRQFAESRPHAKKAGTLDDLIRQFESARWLHPETIELLRFVMKPKRDYIEHGRKLPTPIAKLVLVTLLEVLVSLSVVDD